MAAEEKKIFVYDGFSEDRPVLIGILYAQQGRGQEVCSFEYDSEWLAKTAFAITFDPDLQPFPGRQFLSQKPIFGMFADASPDRWGQTLMNRRERLLADRESRKPKKLMPSDLLLGVCDLTRMGSLRFKAEPEGPFLADDREMAVPPWARLRTLEEASRNYENDASGFAQTWIDQLFRPGSSLGGARPKANVLDTNGDLWIAKFPSRHDEYDSGAWEKTVHDLAALCGLCVPEARTEKFSSNGSTFLIKRFDRDGQKRLHYSSAMTLLGMTDGASVAEGCSYLDIAAFIRAHGSDPKQDLVELWKRIVFNMAVSNTDDHLRNHAFLWNRKGWKLSPLYDVNPTPYGNELSLNVNEYDNRISGELVLSVAGRFGLDRSDAIDHFDQIVRTVNDRWEETAERNGLSREQIGVMRPAFSLK